MIRVTRQPEPEVFDELVRKPGSKYLADVPHPTSKQWAAHDYWTRVKDELYEAYGQVCAYSCFWIPMTTGFRTCDHFVPKASTPKLAFEWTNYRLCCGTMNGRKQTHEDVLDPFKLKDGWFVIDFPSLLVRAADGLTPNEASKIATTIKALGLNDEGTCRRERCHWLREYCQQGWRIEYLETKAPFLASELRRQHLVRKIRDVMRFRDRGGRTAPGK